MVKCFIFSIKVVKYIFINDEKVNWVRIREIGSEYLLRIKCYEFNIGND